MSLERNQAFHNRHIANTGNISASNDATQQPNDANELLIKGASAAAAGRELGLSEEETLAAVSRQYRRQGNKAAIRARRTQEAEALRTWQQKQASLGDWGDGEISGVRYADDDEIALAFGQDQSDYQNFTANDRGFTEDEETGLLRSEVLADERPVVQVDMEQTGTYRDANGKQRTFRYDAPETIGYEEEYATSAPLKDALDQLNALNDPNPGPGKRFLRAMGVGAARDSAIARVSGELEKDIRPDKGADKALGEELVRRDNQRFNPADRETNNILAQVEAEQLLRDGNFVDIDERVIGRLVEANDLGASGMAGHAIGEDAHIVLSANDAIKGQAARRHDGIYLDPRTGDPIALQGPELPPVLAGDRTPNNGSSSNALNAPQTAVDWISQAMPDNREGGRVFNDFPQVDITLQTTNFANRVRDYGERMGLPALGQVSANIRSVDELQKVVNYIAGASAQAGRGLTIPDPANPGKSLAAGNQVTAGVMNAIGMTPGEQTQFANAMFQLDAARRSSVNQNPTGVYLARTGQPTPGIEFDAPEAVRAAEGQAKVARIPKGAGISVGVKPDGKPDRRAIVTQLAQLDTPGAQVPFMGQVQGEKPRINRFNRTGETEPDKIDAVIRQQAESRARRDKKPVDEAQLKDRQVKAKLVQERENRDSRKREEQRRLIQENTPANLRQAGRYDEADQNIPAINRAIRQQKERRQGRR